MLAVPLPFNTLQERSGLLAFDGRTLALSCRSCPLTIFRRRYPSLDLNIGVVIGGDGVLVIDTRASHGQAEELRSEIAGLTSLPIRWVVNSHWHWDHTFGNAVFPDAALWGHRRCREFLLEHVEPEWVGHSWLTRPLRHRCLA